MFFRKNKISDSDAQKIIEQIECKMQFNDLVNGCFEKPQEYEIRIGGVAFKIDMVDHASGTSNFRFYLSVGKQKIIKTFNYKDLLKGKFEFEKVGS